MDITDDKEDYTAKHLPIYDFMYRSMNFLWI